MSDALLAASGWLAAIVSSLSFGSFAVPIKSNECQKNDVDPLVFQTYKTLMCLITSWIVLPFGQSVYFTPWGIVSGLFWVPAGVAAIFAVKNAGLAVSQGLWSSIIVIVSFTWGIFIFHEQVQSVFGSLVAVGLMIIGLWGMSFYSSPEFQTYEQIHSLPSLVDMVPQNELTRKSYDNNESNSASISHMTNHVSLSPMRNDIHNRDNYEVVKSLDAEEHVFLEDHDCEKKGSLEYCEYKDDDVSLERNNDEDDEGLSYNSSFSHSDISSRNNRSHRENTQPFSVQDKDQFISSPHINDTEIKLQQSRKASLVSRRNLGLMSAVFNGVWGGSIMVPMHYAPKEAHGMGYVISFAIGATLITVLLWIARLGYYYIMEGMTLHGSYHSLPSFHFRVMWKPGGTAGLLWSIGNLASMISVQHLGEGVGYSLTQASMLVSGIWGIFYFHEVEGVAVRIKWFLSAIITISGIIMLSFEHVSDSDDGA